MSYTKILNDVIRRIDDHLELPAELLKSLVESINEDNRRYEFKDFLSIGGQGLLVIAYDRKNLQDVVIKFAIYSRKKRVSLRSPFRNMHNEKFGISKEDTEQTARFKRGVFYQRQIGIDLIRTNCAKLGYIPRILESNLDSSKLYFTMEYLQNSQHLLDWCNSRRLQETIQLFHDICKFVSQALHRFGIVHSDLKHQNILVVGKLPVLIDFGIAKDIREVGSHKITRDTTQTSSQYSSPQQQQNFDSRTFQDDIYTLGLTMWSMVLREDPSPKEEIASINTLYRYYDPLRLPEDLREIFLNMTKKRYEVVEDLLKDLKEFLSRNKPKIEISSTKIEITREEVLEVIKDPLKAEIAYLYIRGITLCD